MALYKFIIIIIIITDHLKINFSHKVNNPKRPLDDLWPNVLMSHVQLYPRIIIVIHQSMWIQWLFFNEKLNQKNNDPKITFDPTSVEVTCDSTQGSLY